MTPKVSLRRALEDPASSQRPWRPIMARLALALAGSDKSRFPDSGPAPTWNSRYAGGTGHRA
jgi:hypothetical protein